MNTDAAIYAVALVQGLPLPHGAADLGTLLIAMCALVTGLSGFLNRKPARRPA